MIRGRGGYLGPDLSDIGATRRLGELRESLINPSESRARISGRSTSLALTESVSELLINTPPIGPLRFWTRPVDSTCFTERMRGNLSSGKSPGCQPTSPKSIAAGTDGCGGFSEPAIGSRTQPSKDRSAPKEGAR